MFSKLFTSLFALLLISTTLIAPTHADAACANPPSGLVSWWGGDNNALDIIGTNNGSLQGGITYGQGKVGRAFDFDGASGTYLQVPNSVNLDIQGSLSISAWVYIRNTGGTRLIAGKTGGTQLYSDNDTLHFVIYSGASPQHVVSATALASNSWHHVAGVFDGNTLESRIYIDGVLSNTILISGQPDANTNAYQIGGFQLHGANLDGLIDEVAIFNRALASSDVQNIFNAGSEGICRPSVAPPSGLVSWWRGENSADDQLGANNGTLQGGGYAAGKVGQAFSLDGADDYVLAGDPIPSSLQIQNEISLEAWVYATDISSLQLIAGSQHDGNHAGASIFLSPTGTDGFAGLPDGHIHFQIGGDGSWHATSANAPVPLNQWVHIVATRKAGEEGKIYYNGLLQPSVNDGNTWPTGNINYAGAWFAIGQQKDLNRPFKGLIDEVRVYDRALAAEEIGVIYNAGSSGMYFIPDTTPDAFTFTPQAGMPLGTEIVSNPITVTGINTSTAIGIVDGEFSVSADGGSTWSGFSSSTPASVNPGDMVRVQLGSSATPLATLSATLTIGGVSAAFEVTTAAADDPNATGLITWWRGDNNPFDSVSSHHGAWSGTPAYAPGITGEAISLAGNSKMSMQAFDMGSDWTITAWVNPHSCSDGSHCPILARSGGNQDGLVLTYLGASHGNANQFALDIGDGGWQLLLYSNTTYPMDQWHHVVASKSGDIYSIYVDGTLNAQQAVPGASTSYQSRNLEIGHWYYGADAYTNGLIDEVKIYNRALSPKEVLKIYDPNGPVSWWRGEDNASDSIGNNDGTLQGNATFADGRIGRAFSFDGSNSFVSVPNSSSIDYGSTRSFEMWIYPKATDGYRGLLAEGYGSYSHIFSLLNGHLALYNGGWSPGTSVLSPNAWYHVAFVQNGSTVTMYLNGVLDGTASVSSWTSTGDFLEIGSFNHGNDTFNGLIDEVKIFNRALSASEVGKLSGQVPDAFSFTPVTGAVPSSTVASAEAITVTGISHPAPISISADGEYSVFPSGGSGWSAYSNSTPSTINAGDKVKVRLTASSDYSKETSVTLNIGGVPGTFTVTTVPAPVNGTCGASHGGTFTTAPDTGLCSAGVPSTVSGTGPWSWSCSGQSGGANVDCSASLRTWSVTPTAGAGGSITPNMPQTVNHGATISFTVTPNAGFTPSVSGNCGGSIAGNTYTSASVTGDCAFTISFTDTSVPVVTAFILPANSNSLTVSISTWTTTDNLAVTGYCITETNSSNDCNSWSGTAPISYLVTGEGSHTLYPWVKDGAGNESAPYSSSVTVQVDMTGPAISAFSASSISSTLTTTIGFVAGDTGSGVTGYCITETNSSNGCSWSGTAPASYTCAGQGTRTLYPWARDAAGNISPVAGAPVLVSIRGGDADGNGQVGIGDALRALRITVGLITNLTDAEKLLADVSPLKNGLPDPDGSVGVADALLILRKVVGLINF